MRHVKEITADEENFRLKEVKSGINVIRRDSIKPETEGTYVIAAFRITGYDPDCDGSLMARLEEVTFDKQETTGWCPTRIGLYKDSTIVFTEKELQDLYRRAEAGELL